jgi:hypothetical protein
MNVFNGLGVRKMLTTILGLALILYPVRTQGRISIRSFFLAPKTTAKASASQRHSQTGKERFAREEGGIKLLQAVR